jgi:hypothetical protein
MNSLYPKIPGAMAAPASATLAITLAATAAKICGREFNSIDSNAATVSICSEQLLICLI